MDYELCDKCGQRIDCELTIKSNRLLHGRIVATILTAFGFSWTTLLVLPQFYDYMPGNFAPISWIVGVSACFSIITAMSYPMSRYPPTTMDLKRACEIVNAANNGALVGGFVGFGIGGAIGRGLDRDSLFLILAIVGIIVGSWTAWFLSLLVTGYALRKNIA